MAKNQIFNVAVSLVIVASLATLGQADVVDKSLMQELVTDFKQFSAAALCAADHFGDADADVPGNVDNVIEGGIGYLQQFLGVPLSDEEYIRQSILVTRTAAANMGETHEKCANVSPDYVASNPAAIGSELSAAGKVLLEVSENLACVLQNGDAEALEQVPSFFAKIINNIAADESDDQVNKLFRHEKALANDLGGLVSC
uniref:Secreted protein n=1 Tax=Stomoxys calcitrans TaxID=35570 RepID=A0A1I8P1T2_STOCA